MLVSYSHVCRLTYPTSPPRCRHSSMGAIGAYIVKALGVLRLTQHSKTHFLLADASRICNSPRIRPRPRSCHKYIGPVNVQTYCSRNGHYTRALACYCGHRRSASVQITHVFGACKPHVSPRSKHIIDGFVARTLHGKPLAICKSKGRAHSFRFIRSLIDNLVTLVRNSFKRPIGLKGPRRCRVRRFTCVVQSVLGDGSRIMRITRTPSSPRRHGPRVNQTRGILK